MEDDSTVVIRVDLSQRHGLSASQKTETVAKIGRALNMAQFGHPGVMLNLNAYAYPEN
jgi:hypothetical protein